MASSLFRNISPDPKADDNNIPEVPYWQIYEILMGCRFVLRRRGAAEVDERAALIDRKLDEFRSDICEVAVKLGEEEPARFDDADLLQCIIMPERTFHFRKAKTDEDFDTPWAAEMGWVGAEDLAVLGLMKVDQAIGASDDWNPMELMVTAGLLLEAYTCLIYAERAHGRHILSTDELDRFKSQYMSDKKNDISNKRSAAANKKKTKQMELLSQDLYTVFNDENPDKTDDELIKMVISCYENGENGFSEIGWKLSPDNYSRTISGWIKKDLKRRGGETNNTEKTNAVPKHTARDVLKTVREAHRF